jgi:Zn-dependent protease with chaperone function
MISLILFFLFGCCHFQTAYSVASSEDVLHTYQTELQNVLKHYEFDRLDEHPYNLMKKTLEKEKQYLDACTSVHEVNELKKLITCRQHTPQFALMLLITPDEAPQLYAKLRVIAARLGIKKMPLLYVNHGLIKNVNAFAYSLNEGGPCFIILNASLVALADDESIEGIIAHELVHIAHNDTVYQNQLKQVLTAAQIASSFYMMYRAFQKCKDTSVDQVFTTRLKHITECILINNASAAVFTGIRNFYSRYHELRADKEAAGALGSSLPVVKVVELLEECCLKERLALPDKLKQNLNKNLDVAAVQPTAVASLLIKLFSYPIYYYLMASLAINSVITDLGLGTHPTTDKRVELLKHYDDLRLNA